MWLQWNGPIQSSAQNESMSNRFYHSVMAFSLFWFIVVNNLYLAWPVKFDLWRRMFSKCCYEPSLNSGFLVCCIPRKYWLLVFRPCLRFYFYYFVFFLLRGDLIMISMILRVNELRITVLTQISTAALIKISTLQMQHLFETIWFDEFSEITICWYYTKLLIRWLFLMFRLLNILASALFTFLHSVYQV